MQLCRQATLAQFDGLDHDTFCRQAHPDFSPIGWHLGHIAYTEALWLLERSAGQTPQFSSYRRLFAADTLPKNERVNLPEFEEICRYLAAVRSQVFDYLETADLSAQERLWRWLIQHECQHSETIAIVLQLQKVGGQWEVGNQPAELTRIPVANDKHSEMVKIPAGVFQQGSDTIDALDNERPAYQPDLESYWIDRYPVTCAQYRVFIEAGGYCQPDWWSSEGWQWLQMNPIEKPLYWSGDAAWDNHPVCGVSYYEAEAYARFVGKRLPTESEWEKAARWDPASQQSHRYPWGDADPDPNRCNCDGLVGHTTPIDAYPLGQSASGCYDLLGNVWEWTASPFDGYVGFAHYPYRGYSQVYFDGQHQVLKGGSWATRPLALRSAFRNWYHRHVRQVFAGFRCAKTADD